MCRQSRDQGKSVLVRTAIDFAIFFLGQFTIINQCPSSKYMTLNQCWIIVGPPSTTLDQH